MAVGRLAGQVVANRVSERMVIRWAAVTAGVGACIAATAPSLGVAYVGFSILGLGVSVIAPMAYAWIGRMVPNRYRSHAISRISVVGYAGFFVGPPLMGFLSEGFGLAVSFLTIGGILYLQALFGEFCIQLNRPFQSIKNQMVVFKCRTISDHEKIGV